MSWQAKYILKLLFQKGLGCVPGLFRVQEAVKRLQRKWRPFTDPDFVLMEVAARVRDFTVGEIDPPRVVVEQGTGWHGADLVLFALAGAERIETYDTTPWLRGELLGEILRLAPVLAPRVGRWPGVDPRRAGERARELRALADLDLARQLAGLRCRAQLTRKMARPELEDRSVDLFYSNSVLQRIVPPDLEELLGESARFLRPGGQAFHVIDTKDFHAITDPRVSELGYLCWSERVWSLATSRYLNYQNRLRAPAFVEAFEAAGFEARISEELVSPLNLKFARTHFAADPRFAHLRPEQVAASRVKLSCRLPSGPQPRPPRPRETRVDSFGVTEPLH